MLVKQKFAEGICFKKLFWIFVIGSIFGAYYEEILTFVKTYQATGNFIWTYRRGVIYGPLSPIYGAGAVIFVYLLKRKEHPWYLTLIYGALIGGVFEYLISYLQEIFLGTSSWNYEGQLLDINGRTTIPIMIGWGIMSVVLIKVVYPFISNIIEKIPIKIGTIITWILVILISFDIVISWSALIRQSLRKKGYEPITPVGAFYDRNYPDEKLQKYFTNMEIVSR